jgi:hypothetical protein
MKYKYGESGCALRIVSVTALVILFLISTSSAALIQECADRNYIINSSSHIVEGTVEKVESKWDEGKDFIYTYNNFSIEKYVKGVPIPGNKVQIMTYGGVIGEVVQLVEDQPVFREGKKVRLYLQEENGEFSLACAVIGVEDISTDYIEGVSPDEKWNKTYGATIGWTYSVQPTMDEGYIIAGFTKSDGYGVIDGWIIKTDTEGNEIWNKKFGLARNDVATFVQQTRDSGYIISGYGEKIGAGGAWLIKTDAQGNELWNKIFVGERAEPIQETSYYYSFLITMGDRAEYVQQTSDGGYIVAGTLLIKTDANGNQQWNKTLGESSEYFSVRQTSDGGYVLAGKKYSNLTYDDAWLIKIDANGNEQWNRTFSGVDEDRANSVEQTNDGGYILAGSTDGDVWIIKTDVNGKEMWNKTFGWMYSYDYARSVLQTPDDGYILAATTKSVFNEDAWLIKTNASGNLQWSKIIGGEKSDSADFILLTSDGGYVLAGSTASYGAGSVNAWLIKVGGEALEPTKTPTAIPTRIPTVVPTVVPTVIPVEKAPGFEVFTATTTLLLVITIRRNRRK